MTVAYRYITYNIYIYIYRENVALKSQVWGSLTLAQLADYIICTNMELMQLARIETMCNDQGVIQDFRLGGGGGGGETATSSSKNYVTMGSGGKGA